MEQSFNQRFCVAAKPSTVYHALTKDVCKWWTEQATCACNIGDVLSVRFEHNTHWRMAVADACPCQSLVWHVTEAFHDLNALSRKDEWLGTNIIWQLSEQKNATQISFIHDGLVPSLNCFNVCQAGWQHYLESLKSYLESGQGSPFH